MQLFDQLKRKFLAEKNPASREGFEVIGAPGTQFFAGMLTSEEYNPKLQGQAGITIYDEMRRNDSTVRATLLAVTLPIRQAIWRVEPASDDTKDIEIAEFVSNNLFGGMEITWADFLRQALLHLIFGFMMFEKVLKLEDSKILYRKLAPRLPKTLWKWNVDDEMNLISMTQFVQKGQAFVHATIPAEKLIIFTNEQEGANYEGISLLRSAYKHWYIKDTLYKIDAIKHDRWGVGIPIASMPEGKTESNDADGWAAAKAMLAGLRANERAYVIEPFGYKFRMMEMGSKVGTNVMPSVQHHDELLARNVLAQFLTLGSTKSGSRALGDSFKDLFLLSLQAVAMYIEDVMNREAIRPLVDLNFTVDKYPKLKASNIKEPSFTSMADAVSKLVNAGSLTNDETLEGHIRETGKLPAKMDNEPEPEPKKTTEGCTCGHKHHVKLNENGFRRELFECEKHLNLREMDNRLEKAKEQLVRKIKRIQQDQIERLAKDVTANAATAKTKKTGLLSSEIKGELLEIYRFGRNQVEQELIKQKKKPLQLAEQRAVTKNLKKAKLNPIRTPGEAQAFIDSKANLMANQMAKKYENTALFAELEAQRLGLTKTATTTFITDRLKELSDKEARDAARFSVVEAFGMGRSVEAETRKEDIATAFYSAILDGQQCSVCDPLDGEEHKLNDPKFETPNPNCLGGPEQCRCITIYVLKTEAPAVVQ